MGGLLRDDAAVRSGAGRDVIMVTKELEFDIAKFNKVVKVKVTVEYNLMGTLEITTQIGDEPPIKRETRVDNTNVVKEKQRGFR